MNAYRFSSYFVFSCLRDVAILDMEVQAMTH